MYKDFILNKNEELIDCIRDAKGDVWGGCCRFAARHGISAGLVYMHFDASKTPGLAKLIEGMRPMVSLFTAKLRDAQNMESRQAV